MHHGHIRRCGIVQHEEKGAPLIEREAGRCPCSGKRADQCVVGRPGDRAARLRTSRQTHRRCCPPDRCWPRRAALRRSLRRHRPRRRHRHLPEAGRPGKDSCPQASPGPSASLSKVPFGAAGQLSWRGYAVAVGVGIARITLLVEIVVFLRRVVVGRAIVVATARRRLSPP